MNELENTEGKIKIYELTKISVCLAFVGGFLDTYTYLLRGGVFANAQTGNMVLLGISVANRHYLKAFYYLIPIFAFFLGIIVSEYLKRKFSDSELENWQHISLVIEFILLFIIGLLPNQVPNAIINVTISFICSLQVNSFRKINGTPYASTMCTGNLRSATEQIYLFIFDKEKDAGLKSARYFLVILSFCCGATFGAVLTEFWKEKSILVCCLILLSVLYIILADKRKNSLKKES